MAISKSQALSFFKDFLDGNEKGVEFWSQRKDGFFERCVFFNLELDDLSNPSKGVLFYGIYKYPISQNYIETYLNLDQLDLLEPIYVDFKRDFNQLSF